VDGGPEGALSLILGRLPVGLRGQYPCAAVLRLRDTGIRSEGAFGSASGSLLLFARRQKRFGRSLSAFAGADSGEDTAVRSIGVAY